MPSTDEPEKEESRRRSRVLRDFKLATRIQIDDPVLGVITGIVLSPPFEDFEEEVQRRLRQQGESEHA